MHPQRRVCKELRALSGPPALLFAAGNLRAPVLKTYLREVYFLYLASIVRAERIVSNSGSTVSGGVRAGGHHRDELRVEPEPRRGPLPQ